MPHREAPLAQRALDRRWQLEQAHGVGDRGSALPDRRRHLLVGHREVLDHLLVRGRLFEGVQVVALEVLDERGLQRLAVFGLAHDRRDRLEPGPVRGAPAPLARHQLVAVTRRADQDRLEQTHLADRNRRAPRAPPRRTDRGVDRGLGESRQSGALGGRARSRRRPGRPRRWGSAHPGPYPVRRVAPWLTSLASSRYARAPREVESKTMIGWPKDGASESRTVRGTTVW